MRLAESEQESIIEKFKYVMEKYNEFKDEYNDFNNICQNSNISETLEFDANYLDDFISEELFNRLSKVKESILDEYYPIYNDKNEEDVELAGELYNDSVKQRDNVFKDYF